MVEFWHGNESLNAACPAPAAPPIQWYQASSREPRAARINTLSSLGLAELFSVAYIRAVLAPSILFPQF